MKVAYQALVVGALGGVAKLIIDRSHERDLKTEAHLATAQRDLDALLSLRQDFVRDLTAAAHRIDAARAKLNANRSVKTWTAQIDDEVIPAWIGLREIWHDLASWSAREQPIFLEVEATVVENLRTMARFLRGLIDEYGDHKSRIAELQREAEATDWSSTERRIALDQVWTAIIELPTTGDLVADKESFFDFRGSYARALKLMRSTLVDPEN